MKAIILAAGQGTRLRPITDAKPKCLVELAGAPILEHQIRTLKNCKISNIHLVGGYLSEQLIEYDARLHVNKNYETTNMVASLFCASEELNGNDDVIISYGDIVYQKSVLKKLLCSDAEISLVIDKSWYNYWSARMDNPLSDAETLKIEMFDKVVDIGRKPKNSDEIQGQYTGLIKVRKDRVKDFKQTWEELDRNALYDGKTYENMFMTCFLKKLIHLGWECRAVFINNGWAEIDCESDIAVATDFWSPNK